MLVKDLAYFSYAHVIKLVDLWSFWFGGTAVLIYSCHLITLNLLLPIHMARHCFKYVYSCSVSDLYSTQHSWISFTCNLFGRPSAFLSCACEHDFLIIYWALPIGISCMKIFCQATYLRVLSKKATYLRI